MAIENPTKAFDIEFDAEGRDGWAFGQPSGITPRQWPRSRGNGIPMTHLFTVRIPEQYRCKGPEVAAMSVFQGYDGDGGALDREGAREAIERGHVPDDTTTSARAFWESLLDYARNKHRGEVCVVDEIGGSWGIVYLSEDEFQGTPCTLPAFVLDGSADKLPFARDNARKPFRLVERSGDPNVGKEYAEFPDWLFELDEDEIAAKDDVSGIAIEGYVPMFHALGEKLDLVRFFRPSHFGGTLHPQQGGPGKLSLFFFEFDEALGDPNLGGDGVAQIDLERDTLDWACG
jgi:hypothetical protein